MTFEVVVVGGGPVGLLLGTRLTRLGIDCLVLEAAERATGSRAIGIHPPSLAMLEALGVLEGFLREGVRIERAHAFTTRHKLGAVDLRRAGDRFGFVLSLPQERTEALLERALGARLLRGEKVCDLRPHASSGIDVVAESGRAFTARWVIGCDGGRSLVAASMGATLSGMRSRRTYAMGDFDDHSRFGTDAAIFLADEGLVESFPLPHGRRRWVIEVLGRCAAPRADEIAETVQRRS
ncbi:MAG TPA: FAD-dependent monooxygenase, partial [Polyangiaceae bacterium]|nr:FAD-dependent monooxygenase [Polyangiaceae bacterium]